MTNIDEKIEQILIEALHSFDVHHTSRSFHCTMKAMKLFWEDQNRMLNLTKEIYEVVAAADQHLSASGVYSAIHRVARKAWKHNKKLLLAYDKSLAAEPTNAELLEILLHFLEDPDREKYSKPNRAKP